MTPPSFRKSFKKWLYGSCPGFAGAFPYYGIKIHFQKGSLLFDMVCAQGIFEYDNIRMMLSLARPDTVVFDIGANIGLMSAPLLAEIPKCRVVSFEPSPNVLPFLQRTIVESAYRDRWTLVPKAAGAQPGRLTFHLSDQVNSVYDGLRPTHRAPSVRQVEVEVTTVDKTWSELGSPRVSLIKCDVEGAEWDALHGARACLKAERPPVLLEWNADNIAAYQRPPEALLNFAKEINFQLYSVPNLAEIHTAQQLAVQMCMTETFLLYPNESASPS